MEDKDEAGEEEEDEDEEHRGEEEEEEEEDRGEEQAVDTADMPHLVRPSASPPASVRPLPRARVTPARVSSGGNSTTCLLAFVTLSHSSSRTWMSGW